MIGKIVCGFDADLPNDLGVPDEQARTVEVVESIVTSLWTIEVKALKMVKNGNFFPGHCETVSEDGSCVDKGHSSSSPEGVLVNNYIK